METPTLNTVTLENAKARLEDLVERAQRGEEWVITDAARQPVAKLAAAPPAEAHAAVSSEGTHASLFGLTPGIKLLPGWDDPLEEFEDYM